jgi:sphinganine-1-phosphate aldolase
MMEATKNLLIGIGVYVLLSRLHIFRSIRPFQPVILVSFLVYRFLHDSEQQVSLLDALQAAIAELKNQAASKLIDDFLFCLLIMHLVNIVNTATSYNLRGLMNVVINYVFAHAKALPMVRKEIMKEHKKTADSLEKELKVMSRSIGEPNRQLPEQGWSKEDVLNLMKECTKTEDVIWTKGQLSGAIYHGGTDHQKFLNECFSMYSLANPLHSDIWPSIMKFDAEVIAMTASLVNGGLNTVCGCSSSGGTESIILAVKAHRDYWRDNFDIHAPEIIASVSAHPALEKGCDLMNIKLVKIDMDPVTMKIDMNALRRAIGPNTIMLYASSPSYPYGVMDPIREMSKLAKWYNIGLHVDCCLGGFVLPFAKKAGYPIPDFDFSLPGVTSMSLDTHKYGYTLKGSSVLLFRNNQLRQSMYFCYADWTGGLYTTATLAGSRSGGLIAQCWASLMTMGEHGYTENVKMILDETQKVAAGIPAIDGLKLMGKPDAMIVAFGTTDEKLNVYSVGDKMHAKGWSLNSLQKPASIHLCLTVKHIGKSEKFLEDLAASVAEVRANPSEKSSSAALYGAASALPPGPVADVLKVYNDVVLNI